MQTPKLTAVPRHHQREHCSNMESQLCRILEEQRQEKQRLREGRRAERLSRYELKRQRRLEEDPYASEPSSVSNSTFTLSDDDDGWLSSQAEMVLEPYFMSLDSTWSRLQVHTSALVHMFLLVLLCCGCLRRALRPHGVAWGPVTRTA